MPRAVTTFSFLVMWPSRFSFAGGRSAPTCSTIAVAALSWSLGAAEFLAPCEKSRRPPEQPSAKRQNGPCFNATAVALRLPFARQDNAPHRDTAYRDDS